MIWKNLQHNWCPKCSSILYKNFSKDIVECTSCEFRISRDKFNGIVSRMNSKKDKEPKRTMEDNLEEWNNEPWTDRPEYDEDGEPNE